MPVLIAIAVAFLWAADTAYALLLVGQSDPKTLLCAGASVGVATLLPATLGHPDPSTGHRVATVGGYIALAVGLVLVCLGLL